MMAFRKEPRLRARQSNCSGHSAGATPAFTMRHSARAAPRAASPCARRCCRTGFGPRFRSSTRICRPTLCAMPPPTSCATARRCCRRTPMPKFTACSRMACPCRCAGRMASASPKSPASSTGATREPTTFCSRSRSGFRANSTGAAPIWSVSSTALPLLLIELKGPGENVKDAFDNNIRSYRSRHSAGLCLQRRRHRLERHGDQSRRDLCAV